MRVPLSWLTSMIDIDLTLDELIERLSASGLEVEGVTRPGAGVRGVATARVIRHEPHPDADSLRLVDVTGPGGEGEVRVVCGASNFDVGDVVLHAAVGMQTPVWDGFSPTALYHITRALTRVGLDSYARMIAVEAITRL